MIDTLIESMEEAFGEYLAARDFRSAITMIEALEALKATPPDIALAATLLVEWEPDFPIRKPTT